MGNVCGKGAILHNGVEVELETLYRSGYVAEGNEEVQETALKHFAKMTEAEWNIVMTKGPCGWRMRLPPKAATNKSSQEVDSKHDRQFAAEKSGTKDEGRSRVRSFRESVALAIAPGTTINANTPRSVRGCEVDILHEGCCTVRFDTLNPYIYDEDDGDAEYTTKAELSTVSPLAKEHGTTTKKHILQPKPVILQSTLPLPPQSELYFEVEFLSLQSSVKKPSSWMDISHVFVGLAPHPFPQRHAPGALSHSCAISTSGSIHVGKPEPAASVDALVEGDVLGVLLCRRTGTVLFLLNGAPVRAVSFPDIILNETDPSSFTATEDNRSPPSTPDIYVTIGVIGRGECEINFGGKTYTAHGYIKDISGGIIQSNAPIQARVFGQRLANFSQMLAELQLFYQIYCPVMLPKAKGMVVMNISRREEFEEELKANYGKSLQDVRGIVEDVLRRKLYNFLRQRDPSRLPEINNILQDTHGEIERINDLLRRRYQADLNRVSLRRKQSVERMLTEYHHVHKAAVEATKIDQLAEQALTKPKAVDAYLREKYGSGINILLQKRLEQIYDSYAPDNRSEIPILVQAYPLFDDEFQFSCKLKVKYNLDLFTFSPLDRTSSDLAAIRKNLRPAKMSKKLQLLEGEELRAAGRREEETAPSRRKSRRVDGADSALAKERRSVRRASRAVAGMAAAAAAATAAAQAAENAAAAAAAAAANVKEHDRNKEKLREAREERRKERDLRRKSRVDKDALRDTVEPASRDHEEDSARVLEEAVRDATASQDQAIQEGTRTAETQEETLDAQEKLHRPGDGASEEAGGESTQKTGGDDGEWDHSEDAKQPSPRVAEQQRRTTFNSQVQTLTSATEAADSSAEKTRNGDGPAHGGKLRSVRVSGVAFSDDARSTWDVPNEDEKGNLEGEDAGRPRLLPEDNQNDRDENETKIPTSTEDPSEAWNSCCGASEPREEPGSCELSKSAEIAEGEDAKRANKECSILSSSPSGESQYTSETQTAPPSSEHRPKSAEPSSLQLSQLPTPPESPTSPQGTPVSLPPEATPKSVAATNGRHSPEGVLEGGSSEDALEQKADEDSSACEDALQSGDSSPREGEDDERQKREDGNAFAPPLSSEANESLDESRTSANVSKNEDSRPLTQNSGISLTSDAAEEPETLENVDNFEVSPALPERTLLDREHRVQEDVATPAVLMETAKSFVGDVVRRSSQLTGLDLGQNWANLQRKDAERR